MDNRFILELQNNGFSQHQIEELAQVVSLLELPTRHILINQGDNTDSIYFLLDGLCHACYLTPEGKQYSKEFYWELDWMVGFESLIKQQASPFLLETLTPVQLLCFPMDAIIAWRKEANPLYIKLLETQLLHKETKERFMLLYSAEERYEMFCQSFSDLEKRLSDYQIAAYLGISHVSLSRIKSRLKER